MALGRRILAKPLNYIGTIDAGSRDLDQNLTRTGHRNRQIGQLEDICRSRLIERNRLHKFRKHRRHNRPVM
jgi:hypothetical protein